MLSAEAEGRRDMSKKVSIIIPVKEINNYIREFNLYFQKLDYDNYEILIFPDIDSGEHFDKTRVIASGKVGPAEKRDLAMKYATGDIFAFIDDDAYPRADWLKNSVALLEDDSIAAVGGPAVTPENDSELQQASGKVFESFMCSGEYVYRYKPMTARDVDDFPSVNLIVKRDAFVEVGGFDSSFYPGEDTKLCLDIVKKLGKRIRYSPDVVVWHHRRTLYKGHLRQVANYAMHRGFFVKALPDTSCKLTYFIPSLFLLGIIAGPVISLIYKPILYLYGTILIIYAFLVFLSLGKFKSARLLFLSSTGLLATHLCYGLNFVRGLATKKLYK